jgi:hypothetical protein
MRMISSLRKESGSRGVGESGSPETEADHEV